MAGLTRTFVSPQLKEDVVRDYHDNHMAVGDLKRKYNCAYNTIDKIIKTMPNGFWNNVVPGRKIEPPITEIRKSISPSDRIRLLTEDATTIAELTFQSIKEILLNLLLQGV